MCARDQLLSLPKDLLLAPSEIHVWFLELRPSLECLSELRRTLSRDEELRAQTFRLREDRDHFVASRGLLRKLLASYTRQRPQQLAFSYGPTGKPALESGCAYKDIQFNLSHSGDYALIAIASGRAVGVDVERLTQEREIDSEKIARRFFSSVELASFLEYHPSDRIEAFFRHWIRKEAYLKARGFGLTRHEDGFDAPLIKERTSTFAHADGTTWRAEEVSFAPDYAGTVVAEGVAWQLKSFACPNSPTACATKW